MSRVPRIRFKGFEEDWEQRKLGEVFEEYSEKNHSELPPLTIIQGGGTIRRDESDRALQYDRDSLSNYKMVNKDDFIVHLRSFEGGLEKANTTGIISPAYHTFSGENTDTTFYYTYFRSKKFIETDLKPHVYGIRDGRSIDVEGMKSINIPYTIFEEQSHIGKFIDLIDHLITLHQRKLEKLKIIKKSMLENLFPQNGEKTPKIRFSGFTKDWEQCKLEDFGKATGGTSIESEFSEDGIYKVISIGSYSENSVYNDQGIRAIKSGKTSNRVLNRNDLTMILNDKTTSGNIIGRVLLIEESGIYVYNQRTERIEIYLDEYDPVFLYEMLNAPNIREKIIKQAQGNTQIYVNWTAISLLEYMIPSKEEQVKIGEYLHSISNLITLHQSKLEKLQKIKNSMLESMFV